MNVYLVSRIEKNEGQETVGIFDALDKARAYTIGSELDLLENYPNNTTTSYEIQEWEVF